MFSVAAREPERCVSLAFCLFSRERQGKGVCERLLVVHPGCPPQSIPLAVHNSYVSLFSYIHFMKNTFTSSPKEYNSSCVQVRVQYLHVRSRPLQ